MLEWPEFRLCPGPFLFDLPCGDARVRPDKVMGHAACVASERNWILDWINRRRNRCYSGQSIRYGARNEGRAGVITAPRWAI